MKKIVSFIFIFSGLFLSTGSGYAQDVPMHTQSILQQEFINPAYHSFKDYLSVSAYNRAQWGSQFDYSPETYVVDAYYPLQPGTFGINLEVIREDIGLRKNTGLSVSFCHNVLLSANALLSFGYNVGFLQKSIDRDKILSYPDEDLSFLLTDDDLNTLYPTASVGVFFLTPKFYCGFSSMAAALRKKIDDSQYFPGFDLSAGGMFTLSPAVHLRPGLIVKYYREKEFTSGGGSSGNIPPVYDLSVNFLYRDKIWLGTSHRFNQAQTFSVDLNIGKNLRAGYTYELGIGKGLNQFDTHGFRLSYIIPSKVGEEAPEKGVLRQKLAHILYGGGL